MTSRFLGIPYYSGRHIEANDMLAECMHGLRDVSMFALYFPIGLVFPTGFLVNDIVANWQTDVIQAGIL